MPLRSVAFMKGGASVHHKQPGTERVLDRRRSFFRIPCGFCASPIHCRSRVATPHDDLFHFAFQHPRHAVGWMKSVLPAQLVDAIDWSTVTPAAEKLHGTTLRHRVTDLVFSAEFAATKAPLWLLDEHKSFRD